MKKSLSSVFAIVALSAGLTACSSDKNSDEFCGAYTELETLVQTIAESDMTIADAALQKAIDGDFSDLNSYGTNLKTRYAELLNVLDGLATASPDDATRDAVKQVQESLGGWELMADAAINATDLEGYSADYEEAVNAHVERTAESSEATALVDRKASSLCSK